MKTIGLIGVGLMGHGIATSLQRHGQRLALLEHAGNQPLQDLIAAGARTYASARDLAAQCDVVILCVTGSPQVEALLAGAQGVLASMRSGAWVIDCSTAVPASTEAMAKLANEKGVVFIDAAMTRTPKEAAEGRLNLLVGGTAQQFEDAKPLLACFAENIVHAGPVGAGHRMKLLHNYVSLGTVTLLAEAAACAQAAGIDMATFVQVLGAGGGWGAALDRLKPYLLEGSTSGLKFSISNAVKDITYYNAMANDSHADSTVAKAIKATLEQANAASQANTLLPELVRIISQRASESE